MKPKRTLPSQLPAVQRVMEKLSEMKREEIDWESEKEKKQRDKKAFLKATLRNTQSESPAFFAPTPPLPSVLPPPPLNETSDNDKRKTPTHRNGNCRGLL